MRITTDYQETSAKKLNVPKACLYDCLRHRHHFCHHPALGVFRGKLYAMWSNGAAGEDEPGQRVLYSKSTDGVHWSLPAVLCEAFKGKEGLCCLTAAGFYADQGMLRAYVAAYEYKNHNVFADKHGMTRQGSICMNTMLYILESADGLTWSAPRPCGLPLCPNYGPRPLKSGRLLMTGNWAHAYTDNRSGASGWQLQGFCADRSILPEPISDDPTYFWHVSKVMGFEGGLCEGAFLEDGDKLRMYYRSYGPILYESISRDEGESWSVPQKTDFPNGNSKFYLARLPDGRALYIGNPGPDSSRRQLVLSVADEKNHFSTHYLLESEQTERKFPGIYKGGMYAYPHAALFGGFLYVIYSVFKEDIMVQKIPLDVL